jgi:hypothetical protein
MFVKKPSMALNSILRIIAWGKDYPTLSTLSTPGDETSKRTITTPAEVITRLVEMETVSLSPDPTRVPGAPFPWLRNVRPSTTSSVRIISGQITPDIMQEALHRIPSHKAAGLDGVPCLVLRHVPPALYKALHLLFQALAITGLTPPSLESHTILLYKRGPNAVGQLPPSYPSQRSLQAID